MGRVEQGGGMLSRQLIIGSRSNLLSWGGDALSLFVDAGLGMKFRRCFWEAFVALAWAGLADWPGALALWLSRLLLGHE